MLRGTGAYLASKLARLAYVQYTSFSTCTTALIGWGLFRHCDKLAAAVSLNHPPRTLLPVCCQACLDPGLQASLS